MTKILVWDWPVRVFHWLLVACFLGAFVIAVTIDDDSPVFQYHMLLGLTAGFMVILRVAWGLIGSRYARFVSFAFGPVALVAYLRGALTGKAERFIGHNPGAAYAIVAMLMLPLVLVATGLWGQDTKLLEESHEVAAFLMVATVVAHLAGLLLHTLSHRENIAVSMFTGKKAGQPEQAIASAHPAVALAAIGFVAIWAFLVVGGHDPQQAQLRLFGQTLQLGEAEQAKSGRHEHHESKSHGKSGTHDSDHHDDDDD